MGACINPENTDEDEYQRNQEIDKELRKLRKDDVHTQVKLLLLGTGDSGKSTFAKQMKVIHKCGFAHTELLSFKNILRLNALTSMQKILDYGESIQYKFSKAVTKLGPSILEARELNVESAKLISSAWNDEELKKFMNEHINGLQIPTCSDYFFDHVGRFGEVDYKPSNEDIFRCKLKTTGINETKFTVSDIDFTMVDVGGQRAERKKWLHCFDDVKCVIYLAALDEYNMTLQEDNVTNRLEESLKLFGEVLSSKWFDGKSIILFLNKTDLFKEKIINFPLTDFFDDCDDSVKEFDGALIYMSRKFEGIFEKILLLNPNYTLSQQMLWILITVRRSLMR